MAINPNNGVLDIINGTLRVSSVDIKQSAGFSTAINTAARNDVLLYDDQKTTTTFLPQEGTAYRSTSGVTRDTTAIDFNDGWVYWPLQLPNSWHTDFDMLIASTGGVLTFSLFSTTEPNHTDYTANDGGYKIVFDNTQNQIVIYWEGSVHKTVSADVRSTDWQHVNINYFRGAVSISLAGKVVLNHGFTENYQEADSRYIGFSATSGTSHKIRHLRVHNSDKWLYTNTSNASDIAYVSGNVGIGSLSPTELLDVHGNVHIAKDLTVDGNLTVSGLTTFIDTTNMSVEDPIIELARGNLSDTKDSGFIITRPTSNVTVAYRGDESELALGYTQSGASDTDVTPISDGGLKVKVYGNLFANNITTTGNVEGLYVKGNGSQLTGIATTFQSVSDYGNTTSNTIQFTNADVGIVATGNIHANYFKGDGSELTGIATTLQSVSDYGNTTSNTIQFTNATTALVADSNVGIGTSVPSANLHVVGYQYVNDPPTQSASFDHSDAPLTLTHPTPTSTTAIDDPKALLHLTRDGTQGANYGSKASFKMSRYENSGTASRSRLDMTLTDGTYTESNVMSLRADGRVGVGTTNPGYTLDVAGDINLSGSFYQGGSPFVSSEWTTGSQSLYYRSNVEIGTGNLYVDTTTSNVGIGTTTPAYELDVAGDINFTGTLYENGVAFSSGIDTTQTLALSNATTGLTVSSNAVVTGNVTAESFIGNTLTLNTVAVTTTLGLDEVLNSGNTSSNTIQITNSTESVSNTTGAIVVSGGVGVGSNLFVGKDLTVSGTVTLNAVSLSTTTNFQEVTNDGNTTTNTVEFNNPTTSLVAASNVGIGTGSPRSALDINDTGAMIVPVGTTAEQPGTTQTGMVRYNTTNSNLEFYDGSKWISISGYEAVTATGGTITDITENGIMYRVHTFTTVGNSNFVVTKGGKIDYLIVAGGGGGGGRYHCGGGGGGGVIIKHGISVTPQTYTIVVGDGGAAGIAQGASNSLSKGYNGSNSSAFGDTAIGGGGGGSNQDSATATGINGGSGGGGSGSSTDVTNQSGDGIAGQGHRGGNGLGSATSNFRVGGGGGGAGGPGGHAVHGDAPSPGDGGPGIPSMISGTLTYYGGGGGGGGLAETTNMGSGGIGGGGDGASGAGAAPYESPGEDGKGGGGGGSNSGIDGVGVGGSGVVIIRYRI